MNLTEKFIGKTLDEIDNIPLEGILFYLTSSIKELITIYLPVHYHAVIQMFILILPLVLIRDIL